jgi:hypothetical protein
VIRSADVVSASFISLFDRMDSWIYFENTETFLFHALYFHSMYQFLFIYYYDVVSDDYYYIV